MPFNPIDQGKFKDIAETLLSEASKNLSMLLSSKLDLKFGSWSQSNLNDATHYSCSFLAPAGAALEIEASPKLAWIVADLMTGGKGTWAEGSSLDESQTNALTEAFNQSITAVINKLKSKAPMEMQSSSLTATGVSGNTFSLGVSIDELCSEEIYLSINDELMQFMLEAYSTNPQVANEREHGVSSVEFAQSQLSSPFAPVSEDRNLNLLLDIRMGLTVELGRSEMPLKDILKLSKGSVIELDRLSGEPVDLFVNNKLIARGEVVVIDDNFGLRITQLAGNLNLAHDMGLMAAAE